MDKRYELQRSDVERAWANHVAAAVGEQWPQRNSCRDAIQRFLDSVGVSDPSGSPRLVIGQREILRWMIQDVAGKSLSYAAERLAVLDHLLNRVRFVRRFFEYLLSLAVVMDNPVPRLLTSPRRMPHSAFKPYIFTREQLAAILAAARQLPGNHVCRYRAQICVTMLTLLHALGLRHGEVRRLRLCDLQLDRRTLFIAQTKFHKSRYVPFGPKVGHCLQRYLEVRHTLVQPMRDDDPLFVTKWRKPLGFKMLLKVFRNILSTLGITGMPSQGAPRIHDLRHSFAVNRLLRWYREGLNVQSRLPLLSTFLGHANPQSTEVYLTITADLLREANARFHTHFGSQFDEVGHP